MNIFVDGEPLGLQIVGGPLDGQAKCSIGIGRVFFKRDVADKYIFHQYRLVGYRWIYNGTTRFTEEQSREAERLGE